MCCITPNLRPRLRGFALSFTLVASYAHGLQVGYGMRAASFEVDDVIDLRSVDLTTLTADLTHALIPSEYSWTVAHVLGIFGV